eukprot:2490832-Karenia_brevis.AAC.1
MRYYSEEEKREDDAEREEPTGSTIPNFPEYDSSQRLKKYGAGAAKVDAPELFGQGQEPDVDDSEAGLLLCCDFCHHCRDPEYLYNKERKWMDVPEGDICVRDPSGRIFCSEKCLNRFNAGEEPLAPPPI